MEEKNIYENKYKMSLNLCTSERASEQSEACDRKPAKTKKTFHDLRRRLMTMRECVCIAYTSYNDRDSISQ
jgi:hypothetical protein